MISNVSRGLVLLVRVEGVLTDRLFADGAINVAFGVAAVRAEVADRAAHFAVAVGAVALPIRGLADQDVIVFGHGNHIDDPEDQQQDAAGKQYKGCDSSISIT